MTAYYDENADAFFESTAYVDMSANYKDFLASLPQGGRILDIGCGSGRDSLRFKEQGYQVTAIDGSLEMCRLASQYIGQPVLCMKFDEIRLKDLDSKEQPFDGAWASASLLHVPSKALGQVLDRISQCLKAGGVLYASFKYGTFEGERNGRYFHDLTEEAATKILTQCEYNIRKMWITADVRAGRESEKWINILVEKKA